MISVANSRHFGRACALFSGVFLKFLCFFTMKCLVTATKCWKFTRTVSTPHSVSADRNSGAVHLLPHIPYDFLPSGIFPTLQSTFTFNNTSSILKMLPLSKASFVKTVICHFKCLSAQHQGRRSKKDAILRDVTQNYT